MASSTAPKGLIGDIKSTSGAQWLTIFKQAGLDWMEDKATKLAASLAFYTMLSIAPLLIITIKVIGWFGQGPAAQENIRGYLTSNMGEKAAQSVGPMIDSATKPGSGGVATLISVLVLLFSASGVFGELQDSLNTIWEVKPRSDRGMMGTIKDRFFSFTMVLGVIFLLLVSLVATTVLSAISSQIGGASIIWKVVNFIVSLVVVSGLFALIFRYIPDAKVRWRDVLVGGSLTAVLFTIGKALLGWYLGQGATTSVYGAAGSLVAMLLWVYYSSQILFFGAEFTQAWARAHGNSMEPTANAVRMTDDDRDQAGLGKPEASQERRAARSRPLPPVKVVPQPEPALGLKDYAIAAGGLTAGALAAWYAARHGTGAKTEQLLTGRLASIEKKVGRLQHLKEVVTQVAVADRMKEVERQLRHARTAVRADEGHRPRWAVTLGDKIAGNR